MEGKTVNKTQLIDALAARFEGNRKAAADALDKVLDTITREVARGEKVAITGFGSFEKRVRDARWVRNPRTGERMKAKKKAVPKFTPGADLKNIVSGVKKLPKLPAATKAAASKVTPTKSTAAKTTAAKKTATKSTAKKAAPAKKATTSKAAPAKAAATKATAKKATTKTAAKKSTAKKTSAATATKKATTAKKATAKTTAKKAPAKKTTTKKAAAKKSGS